jgi:hypothetical protein
MTAWGIDPATFWFVSQVPQPLSHRVPPSTGLTVRYIFAYFVSLCVVILIIFFLFYG